MQRCLSIFRRNATAVAAGGALLIGTYEFCKQTLMQTGKIESDLARVTMSKIGSEDPYYSREKLLSRLINYRHFFRIIYTSRESTIAARLDNAIVDMQTDVSTGSLRAQPYCIMLYGPPGVGKSSFAIQLAQAIMKADCGTFSSHDMVTLNETDDFQSEFRTSHKVVLFDDIAASKSDCLDTKNPWRKVIDFVNNVQKTALNPNCELKGKVYIKPKLVILTSNIDFSRDYSAVGKYMYCPQAIQRRIKGCVQLINHQEVIINQYISAKRRNAVAFGDDTINPLFDQGLKISREEAISIFVNDYLNHMAEQNSFISHFNGFFDDFSDNTLIHDNQSDISPAFHMNDSPDDTPIYVNQSEIAPAFHINDSYKGDYDGSRYHSILYDYLLKNIDWPLYWAMYFHGHSGESELKYWDGVIYLLHQRYPDNSISVSLDLMNDLRDFKYHTDFYVPSDSLHDSIPELDPPEELLIFSKSFSEPIEPEFLDIPGLRSESQRTPSDSEYYELVMDARKGFNEYINDIGTIRSAKDIRDHFTRCRVFGLSDEDVPGLNLMHMFFLYGYHLLDHPDKFTDFVYSYGLFSIANFFTENLGTAFIKREVLGKLIHLIAEHISNMLPYKKIVIIYILSADPYLEYSNKTVKRYRNVAMLAHESSLTHCTEDHIIENYFLTLPHSLRSPLLMEKNLRISNFGEIDLVLKYEDFILIFEFKVQSDCRPKAIKQATKYSEVMSILQPNKRIFGIIVLPDYSGVVYDNGVEFESNLLIDFFGKLEYTPL